MVDAHETVFVDREKEPWRWRCPEGHSKWSATNNHVWCGSCRRAVENGAEVDPEHWELLDLKEDRLVPYAAVELVS